MEPFCAAEVHGIPVEEQVEETPVDPDPHTQTITTNDEALAVIETMSTEDLKTFIQGLFHSKDMPTPPPLSHMTAFINRREAHNVVTRREARVSARQKRCDAIKSINAVIQFVAESDNHVADLTYALERLNAQTEPVAKGTAEAERIVWRVALECAATPHSQMDKAMKQAEHNVRDTFMFTRGITEDGGRPRPCVRILA
jgi:hypothetical protein